MVKSTKSVCITKSGSIYNYIIKVIKGGNAFNYKNYSTTAYRVLLHRQRSLEQRLLEQP